MNPHLNQMLIDAHTADLRRAADSRQHLRELARQRQEASPLAGTSLTIRRAYADDELELGRLAMLDDAAPVPTGAVLVAEVDGAIRAALGDGRHVISDPFFPSAELVELLRLRVQQTAPPRRQRGGYLVRARAALQHPSRRPRAGADCA